jgi:hypothetical protein
VLPLVLSACSSLSLSQEDTPAAGPDPSYDQVVAEHVRASFSDTASYDVFEISEYRWVHTTKGWSWLTCVRFQNKGRRLTYAVFLRQKEVVNERYAVETDGCGEQTYTPFALANGARTGPRTSGGLEPLY